MTDYTTEEYHQAIREIAERLDEVRPNWREQVNVHNLHWSDSKNCLFGQVFGDWKRGFIELNLPFCDPNTDIFYSPHAMVTAGAGESHRADWVQVIVEGQQ